MSALLFPVDLVYQKPVKGLALRFAPGDERISVFLAKDS
jgi:hypothetical protein